MYIFSITFYTTRGTELFEDFFVSHIKNTIPNPLHINHVFQVHFSKYRNELLPNRMI